MAERNSSPARTSAGSEARRSTTQPSTQGIGQTHESASDTESTGMVDRMKGRASEQINSQKNKATDGLGTMAQAVRQSTQQLRNQQHDTVANYVEQAADQIERLSQRLKQKDVGELLSDAQRLARRQPALFVGSAFALGLIGARVMKSSPRDEYQGGYGATGGSRPQYGGTYRGYDYERQIPATTSTSRATTGAATPTPGRSPSTAVGGSTGVAGSSTPGSSAGQTYRSHTENK
jgi:hypothetical protein